LTYTALRRTCHHKQALFQAFAMLPFKSEGQRETDKQEYDSPNSSDEEPRPEPPPPLPAAASAAIHEEEVPPSRILDADETERVHEIAMKLRQATEDNLIEYFRHVKGLKEVQQSAWLWKLNRGCDGNDASNWRERLCFIHEVGTCQTLYRMQHHTTYREF
jgi:hypothetical protein